DSPAVAGDRPGTDGPLTSMNSSEDFQYSGSGLQLSVIIIPALLAASTMVAVIIILWKVFRGRKGQEAGVTLYNLLFPSDDRDAQGAVNVGGVYEDPLGAPDPVLEKKQVPRDWRMEDRVVLCPGHFGPISGAVLVGEDRHDVVLKELSDRCTPGEVQDFMDLLRFYVQVCNHDSLVRMLWCQTEARPVCLIMEAMTRGNLLVFLRESHEVSGTPRSRITERDVYSMASQVASGLEYLAGTHNLAHGYVAACNVLIHRDMSVRLCGLGLASIQHRTGS
ncbi:PREDICTED: tyrosine-protein kinase STYK1-like, partial [Nanorana parkeri]|uniref:tyrosine-protein kinase STYK1-like n=1 Tax=Nanorana parkeri TaxID=125878 RepID=UPI00085442D4